MGATRGTYLVWFSRWGFSAFGGLELMSTACPGVVKCYAPPDPAIPAPDGDDADAQQVASPVADGGEGGAAGAGAGAGAGESDTPIPPAPPAERVMVFDDLPDDYTVLRKATGGFFRIPPGFMYYEDQMLGKRYQVGVSFV